MKAGKSTGKKSAATSGKKAPRKKSAPLSSKGNTKKSSLPASAKKAPSALSPGKKASGAPPVSTRKKSAKKKPAVAEKARVGITGGDRKVKRVRAKATPQKPAEAAEKKMTRRTAKTAIKGKKNAITRKTKGQGTARPRRRAVKAGLPDVPAGEVLAAAGARPALTVKKAAAARRKIELAAARSRYELPREYGEDDITAIVVDPYEVFAHWEIRKEHFTGSRKKLILRLQNSEPEGNGSYPWTEDIVILHRVGSGFFPLGMQGGHAVIIMGTVGPGGRFRPIVCTGRLTIPVGMSPQADETPVGRSSERIGY